MKKIIFFFAVATGSIVAMQPDRNQSFDLSMPCYESEMLHARLGNLASQRHLCTYCADPNVDSQIKQDIIAYFNECSTNESEQLASRVNTYCCLAYVYATNHGLPLDGTPFYIRTTQYLSKAFALVKKHPERVDLKTCLTSIIEVILKKWICEFYPRFTPKSEELRMFELQLVIIDRIKKELV